MALRIGTEMPSFDGATEWVNGEITPQKLLGKPTIIQFWALSCYICKNNMPTIAEWKKTFANEVNFVSVHMPRQESDTDVAAVKAAIAAHGIDEPCAIDSYHEIGERFETSSYWPYYFLFDADGKMKSRSAGDVGVTTIKTALDRLLQAAAATV